MFIYGQVSPPPQHAVSPDTVTMTEAQVMEGLTLTYLKTTFTYLLSYLLLSILWGGIIGLSSFRSLCRYPSERSARGGRSGRR